jgi:hypothetical protein
MPHSCVCKCNYMYCFYYKNVRAIDYVILQYSMYEKPLSGREVAGPDKSSLMSSLDNDAWDRTHASVIQSRGTDFRGTFPASRRAATLPHFVAVLPSITWHPVVWKFSK